MGQPSVERAAALGLPECLQKPGITEGLRDLAEAGGVILVTGARQYDREHHVHRSAVGGIVVDRFAELHESPYDLVEALDAAVGNGDSAVHGRASQLLSPDQAVEDLALAEVVLGAGEHLTQYIQRVFLGTCLDIPEHTVGFDDRVEFHVSLQGFRPRPSGKTQAMGFPGMVIRDFLAMLLDPAVETIHEAVDRGIHVFGNAFRMERATGHVERCLGFML